MNLFEAYHEEVKKKNICDDAEQRLVMSHFQRLANDLSKKRKWYSFLKKQQVPGIYVCGPVGIGKTYLMDLFYQHVAESKKSRFHFHYFMQQIDQQLRLLQGHPNPLKKIAKKLSKTTRVLCLDEFLVSDVAYAMILAELLTALFHYDVILVATANTKPDDLYLNGVGRERFLPAIDLIKKNCEVLELPEHRDYRLGRTASLESFVYPLTDQAAEVLLKQYKTLTHQDPLVGIIEIQHRNIAVLGCAAHVVWFEFDVICHLPRCQLDYIEIAERFDTVIMSGVKGIDEQDTATVILLIHLVDVFYDRGVRLIISSAVPVTEIYVSGEKQSEFVRTLSRLQEMQSSDYLSRHIPSQQLQSEIV